MALTDWLCLENMFAHFPYCSYVTRFVFVLPLMHSVIARNKLLVMVPPRVTSSGFIKPVNLQVGDSQKEISDVSPGSFLVLAACPRLYRVLRRRKKDHLSLSLMIRNPIGNGENILVLGIMENKMETTIVYWGYIGIMENKMEATIVYWGYIGIMENKMEATIVYWGYIGIMENKMEATIVYYLVEGLGMAESCTQASLTGSSCILLRALRGNIWPKRASCRWFVVNLSVRSASSHSLLTEVTRSCTQSMSVRFGPP